MNANELDALVQDWGAPVDSLHALLRDWHRVSRSAIPVDDEPAVCAPGLNVEFHGFAHRHGLLRVHKWHRGPNGQVSGHQGFIGLSARGIALLAHLGG